MVLISTTLELKNGFSQKSHLDRYSNLGLDQMRITLELMYCSDFYKIVEHVGLGLRRKNFCWIHPHF